jgi:hypothetical protein
MKSLRVLVPIASLAVGAAVVALPGGCSSTAPPGPATVRGKVTFQGAPLVGGLVVLAPDRDRGTMGKPARGEIGPDGTFQLRHDADPHIPPGWYRVAIAAPPGGPPLDPGRPAFPPQLRRPDTSGLIREVVAGKEHHFEFAVEVPNN